MNELFLTVASSLENQISMAAVVIAGLSAAIPVLVLVLTAWIKMSMRMTQLETSTNLELMEIKKDVDSNKSRLEQHDRWFYSHQQNSTQLKEGLTQHINGVKDEIIKTLGKMQTDIEVLKAKR